MLSIIPYFDKYACIIVLCVSISNLEFCLRYRKFCAKIQFSSLAISKCCEKGKLASSVCYIKKIVLKTSQIKKFVRSAEGICDLTAKKTCYKYEGNKGC